MKTTKLPGRRSDFLQRDPLPRPPIAGLLRLLILRYNPPVHSVEAACDGSGANSGHDQGRVAREMRPFQHAPHTRCHARRSAVEPTNTSQ